MIELAVNFPEGHEKINIREEVKRKKVLAKVLHHVSSSFFL